MNKTTSFFLGLFTGVVLTVIVLGTIGSAMNKSGALNNEPLQYFEKPVSYENKTETSFKVQQVISYGALAEELSDKELNYYGGNTVLLLGDDFYDDQIINIKSPMRVGKFSYTTKGGLNMTVPVLKLK